MQQKLREQPEDATGQADARLRALLADSLGLERERVDGFTVETPLFGAFPEFDSMAVATFLTEFEERFDVLIEDEDVEAEDFATYGSLLAFTRRMTER